MELHVKMDILTQIEDKTFKQINNPVRQRILQLIGEKGVVGYNTLKNTLKIPSGTLYYHLKILKDDNIKGFVSQNSDKLYYLTSDGAHILNYIYTGSLDEIDHSNEKDIFFKEFHQISNPIRRNILSIIEQEGYGIGYNDLLSQLNITSGSLYFHLRNLKGIVIQNEELKYILSNKGKIIINNLYSYIKIENIPLNIVIEWKLKGNYQKIIKTIKPSLEHLELTYLLIDAYIETRLLDKAEKILKKLEPIDTPLNSVIILFYQSKCLIAVEKFVKAESIIENGLLLLSKTFKNIHISRKKEIETNFQLILSEVKWRQHKFQDALEILQTLLENSTDSENHILGPVYDKLASIYWIQGNANQAIENINLAINHFQLLKNQKLVELAQTKREMLTQSMKKAIDKKDAYNKALKDTINDFKLKI